MHRDLAQASPFISAKVSPHSMDIQYGDSADFHAAAAREGRCTLMLQQIKDTEEKINQIIKRKRELRQEATAALAAPENGAAENDEVTDPSHQRQAVNEPGTEPTHQEDRDAFEERRNDTTAVQQPPHSNTDTTHALSAASTTTTLDNTCPKHSSSAPSSGEPAPNTQRHDTTSAQSPTQEQGGRFPTDDPDSLGRS